MASIQNKLEAYYLHHYLARDNYWVGLNAFRTTGAWEWIDGSAYDFPFFRNGYGSKGGDNVCALTYSTGLADVECYN